MTTAFNMELEAAAKRRLRVIAETYYDVQDIRIRTEHRIRNYAEADALATILTETGLEDLRDEGQKEFKKVIRHFRGVQEFKKKPHPKHKEFMAALLAAEKRLEDDDRHVFVNRLMRDQEDLLKSLAQDEIEGHPIWEKWLKGVKGIGPCLCGGLLSWITIRKARHAGSLWKYCGQAVTVTEYVCPECKKTFEPKEVPDIHERIASGKSHEAPRCPDCEAFLFLAGHADRRKKGEQTGYNPKAKTLAWKIGESLVRQTRPEHSAYRKVYDVMREKVDSMPCNKVHKNDKDKVIPCFDAHRYAKAKRLTVKVFLSHFYLVSRTFSELPVSKPYRFGMMNSPMDEFVMPRIDEGVIPEEVREIVDEWKSE